MKKLLLIRHAKATHESAFKDFERPLTQSGMKDATAMAGRLHMHGHIPQHIISSSALRAISTANIFTEHLSLAAASTNKYIYDATADSLLNVVNELPNAYDFIALVGHNPGMAQLLHYLTGQIKDVPICAIALIDFEVDDWQEVGANSGNLVYFDIP
jgi:phosphohistidine phosphatase